MIRTLSLATTFASVLAVSAMAQDAKTKTEPGTGPMSTQTDQMPQVKKDAMPGQSNAPSSPGTSMGATPAQSAGNLSLTEQESKIWIDRPVYSSDGKKLGEVVAFQRDAASKVTGLHVDIGGFLGMGQTRVNLTPTQFKLQGDRVVLDLTAAQAKDLPKIQS